jgi:hypothetical protein
MSLPKATIDHKSAEQRFQDAIAVAQDITIMIPTTVWDQNIITIVQGKHLTFRYLLITALLGKATNPMVNALALQAGADLEGAYDARSLCHGVVVPMERRLLNRAIGGSNEPFLNKPARFPSISLNNAVRAGRDRILLEILHQVLSEIQTADQAFNALCHALRQALEKQQAQRERIPQATESPDAHLNIIKFMDAFLTRSVEGQIAAIVTGTLLSIHFEQFEEYRVTLHPVNQSGASSNEIADIDIRKNGNPFLSIEVKDKSFSEQDVDHAAFKARQYGLNCITFVIGIHGQYIGTSLEQVAQSVFQVSNVNVIFVEVVPFLRSVLALCPNLTYTQFLTKLQDSAIVSRAKDEVYEQIEVAFKLTQV